MITFENENGISHPPIKLVQNVSKNPPLSCEMKLPTCTHLYSYKIFSSQPENSLKKAGLCIDEFADGRKVAEKIESRHVRLATGQ